MAGMFVWPANPNAGAVVCDQPAGIFNRETTFYKRKKIFSRKSRMKNIDIYDDELPSGAYFMRLQNKLLQKMLSVLKIK